MPTVPKTNTEYEIFYAVRTKAICNPYTKTQQNDQVSSSLPMNRQIDDRSLQVII